MYPDFKIHNTSKVKGTDNYDAIYKGKTIDVKVNRNHENPLMIPEYAKTDCNLFALFSCIYPRYRFEGFATNKMVFDKSKLRMTRVKAYVTEKADLLVNYFSKQLSSYGIITQQGEFGAHMMVSLVNDGPVTIWLEN